MRYPVNKVFKELAEIKSPLLRKASHKIAESRSFAKMARMDKTDNELGFMECYYKPICKYF
jgi:hypothetical protein